jgi:DNA-binding MarR family transcriptional regulator
MLENDILQVREILQQLVRNIGVLQREGSQCCGATVTQSHILYELDRTPNLSHMELAGKLSMDTGLLSRQVNKLVEENYVLRIPNPNDKRYVVLALSDIGKRKAKEISDQMSQYIQIILQRIPIEKQQQVKESLHLLSNAIKQ